MIAATIYDALGGTASVGQCNVVLNGVGKLLQTKKMEMQMQNAAARHPAAIQSFVLPGSE